MKNGTDLQLEYRAPEQRLLELLKRWAPPSGFGRATIELEWQDGQMTRAIRLNGEESVKLT